MSHSFYISGVGEASLSQTLDALPFDNLVVHPENPNGGWPEIAHVYQDNVSVRSIETAMSEGGTLQVRIMANSSPDDFRLAAAIVDYVASTFGKDIDPEDNDTMSLDQWRDTYGEEWQRNQARTYLQMLVNMYQSEKYEGNMTMFGTTREFEVGPRLMEPLLEDPSNFSMNFFERFRRLNYLEQEDVFGPSLLGAKQDGTDKQAVFSVLGDDCITALSNQAGFVVLTHESPAAEDGGRGQTILTFDDFAEIAGDSLTWLGDGVAVTPPYKGEAWQSLVDAAQSKKTDFFAHPDLLRESSELESSKSANGAEETPFGINEDQWQVMGHAVVGVFILVAGADGNVDKKELSAFTQSLVEGVIGMGNSKVMAVAMMTAAAGIDQRIQDLGQRDGVEIAQLIAASRQIVVEHAGEDEARSYAEALYAMAESIASASGGFFGFGNKIDKNEQVMLDGIRQLLQLDGITRH